LNGSALSRPGAGNPYLNGEIQPFDVAA